MRSGCWSSSLTHFQPLHVLRLLSHEHNAFKLLFLWTAPRCALTQATGAHQTTITHHYKPPASYSRCLIGWRDFLCHHLSACLQIKRQPGVRWWRELTKCCHCPSIRIYSDCISVYAKSFPPPIILPHDESVNQFTHLYRINKMYLSNSLFNLI